MQPATNSSRDDDARPDERRCEYEFHLRVCARRLTTGHLQYRWRVEHVDSIGQTGDSNEGTFGPFQLPHECGQEAGAALRYWIKIVNRLHAARATAPTLDAEPDQLTLSDALAQWESDVGSG